VQGTGVYCYLQGTSMASPHVVGVAALIISRYGKLSTGRVSAYLQQTADAQPCPSELSARYLSFTGADDGQVQTARAAQGTTRGTGPGR